MSLSSSHDKMKPIRSFEAVLLVWSLFFVCTIIGVCALSLKAHAFTTENINQVGLDAARASLDTTSTSSNSGRDGCVQILQSAHFVNSPSSAYAEQNANAMNPTRRKAGQAAALSLMLGVRIAIPPIKKRSDIPSEVAPAVWMQTYDNPALVVSAYRNCKKQEALYRSR